MPTDREQALAEELATQREQLSQCLAQLASERQESARKLAELESTVETLRERLDGERELYEELMRMQDAAMAELSTPLIPVAERVLVLPLIGAIDDTRAQRILEVVLQGATSRRARCVIIDVSGIPRFHATNAKLLFRLSRALRLIGAEMIITGLGAAAAQALVALDTDLRELTTRAELRAGIELALRQTR
jgi:rsbT co-antagonist protein RsbR